MGKDTPKIQIAPVLQKLIFPRSKEVLLKWLENIKCFEDMEYLIPAHFTAPIKFTIEDCQKLINEINSQKWDKLPEDNKFLMGLYKKLFELGIIPEEVNLLKLLFFNRHVFIICKSLFQLFSLLHLS